MEQLSFLDAPYAGPAGYEDIEALLEQAREGQKDAELYGVKEGKKARTYSFCGAKVLEFRPAGDGEAAVLRVSADVAAAMGQTGEPDKDGLVKVALTSQEAACRLIEALTARKRSLFRGLSSDSFACCNDFRRCSEAGECLHPLDRFYNGCEYRVSLEKGKVFFGGKRNTDT